MDIRETEDYKSTLLVLRQFQRIEQKNRCVRVRFLDWLAAKLQELSIKTKNMADQIHSPCALKLKE